MLELGAIFVLVMLAWAAVAVLSIVFKLVIWLVLLPVRLVFFLLSIIFWPVLIVAAVAAALAVAAAIIVPLFPVLAVAGLAWFLVRAANPTAAVSGV